MSNLELVGGFGDGLEPFLHGGLWVVGIERKANQLAASFIVGGDDGLCDFALMGVHRSIQWGNCVRYLVDDWAKDWLAEELALLSTGFSDAEILHCLSASGFLLGKLLLLLGLLLGLLLRQSNISVSTYDCGGRSLNYLRDWLKLCGHHVRL